MIELDAALDIHVDPAEYSRLLGYPRGHVLSDRALELAAAAREWYREHGRPWIYARQADSVTVDGAHVAIDGVPFSSQRLAGTLRQAGAHSAFLVAVSAGPEAEEHAQRLWREEKPDEYFFLETYASAVVEQLIAEAGARLCAWAEPRAMAVLPHSSPGYSQWDVSEQGRLRNLMHPPDPLETLDSGALRPKKSQLAVFGVTFELERVRRLAELVPCQSCQFAKCQFRRTAYLPEPDAARYTIRIKALQRWAAERLHLSTRPDGAVEASFRYDGTTCSNMGRALAFQYFVVLGPRENGYPIREQHCAPVPGDTGHTAMCEYIADANGLMSAIERHKPLLGQPLVAVFDWRRESSPAGCYCDASSRDHKWGLVLETIHYALHN